MNNKLLNPYDFQWGTYGKSGKEPLKYLYLTQLSTPHIYAILRTQRHLNSQYINTFKAILKTRKKRVPKDNEIISITNPFNLLDYIKMLIR